jgi:hypothetical protein
MPEPVLQRIITRQAKLLEIAARQKVVAIDFALQQPLFARIPISDSNGGADGDGEVCKIAPCRKRHRESQESDSGEVDMEPPRSERLRSRGDPSAMLEMSG